MLNVVIKGENERMYKAGRIKGTHIEKLRGESKKSTCLLGCGIKSIQPIFNIEISFYQSKANLDVKILYMVESLII